MTALGALRVRVADTRRAEVFFGSTFGWTFRQDQLPGHREVTALGAAGPEATPRAAPDLVFTGDPREPAARLCLSAEVPSLLAEKIQALGGRVESAQRPASAVAGIDDLGAVACIDDQGTPLLAGRPAVAGAQARDDVHGELGVIFVFVGDLDRAAAFYGDLLGWRFAAIGRDRDILFLKDGPPVGLRPAAKAPGGVSGSVTFHISVPDAGPAMTAIEALGGQVGAAAPAAAFSTRACTDDQGTAFSLWFEAPGH